MQRRTSNVAPFAVLLGTDLPTVKLYQGLDNCQSEPAPFFTTLLSVTPVETVNHPPERYGRGARGLEAIWLDPAKVLPH